MSPLTITWTGQAYRGHNPEWAFAPTSGDGARQHGGRFNPPGVPALYTATSPETAWLEAQQGYANTQPLTVCAYEVVCQDILDLTKSSVRQEVQIALDDLSCAWEAIANAGQTPPSWRIASGLIELGVAGVLVPCFALQATAHDINLVFWDWSDSPPHQVVVIDDEGRLPKNNRSWR